MAIQWRLQSQINAQVRDRQLSWTRTGVRVAELRQATDRFALVDEEIVEVVLDQAGEVQFAGDNGVVDTLQDEADDNTPLPESKIRPIDILLEVLTLQSSLSAKASVDAVMLCLRKQGQSSPGFRFETDEQGGDQFASQEMTYHAARQIPGSSERADLKYLDLLSCPNQLVCSEHRHLLLPGAIMSLNKSFFDTVNFSVRKIFVRFQTTFV